MENESIGFTPFCISCSFLTSELKSRGFVDSQFEKSLEKCSNAMMTGLDVPKVFASFQSQVKQSVLSQSHLCLLFEDGRVCRIRYYVDDSKGSDALNQEGENEDVPPSVKRSTRLVQRLDTNTGSLPTDEHSIGSTQLMQRFESFRNSRRLHANNQALESNNSNQTNTQNPQRLPNDNTRFHGDPSQSVSLQLQSTNATNSAASHASNNIPSPYTISLSRLVRSGQRSRHGGSVVLLGPAAGSQFHEMISADEVPEELIEEAQQVLQGKSRSTIIRELQRTNLDINVAVNNLLGRDEGTDSGGEDEQYRHNFEDILSLMSLPIVDANTEIPTNLLREAVEEHLESSNIPLRCSALGRRAAILHGRTAAHDPRSANSWNVNTSATAVAPTESNTSPQSVSSPATKSNLAQSYVRYPALFDDEIEWCKFTEEGEVAAFSQIAALHSELLLITADDNCSIVQWKYNEKLAFSDPNNPKVHHPRAERLGIANEKITSLQASVCRAVLLTSTTHKICSFVDESLGVYAMSKLDHPAFKLTNTNFKPVGVFTAPNLSAVLCENDHIFWWGAVPKNNRISVLKKARDNHKSSSRASNSRSSQSDKISVGCKVVMNAVRFIQVGALGYIVKEGIPKVGQLLDTVISTDSTYRFLVRNDISFNHDILSSYELSLYEERKSQQQAPGSKRKHSNPVGDTGTDEPDDSINLQSKILQSNPLRSNRYNVNDWYEENWHLADVIFIEDTPVTALGTVLMVDKNAVLVKLDSTAAANDTQSNCQEMEVDSEQKFLSNTRIFRKDDLKIYEEGRSSFVPNYLVTSPQRLIVDFGKPLAIHLSDDALHCVSYNSENKASYLITADLTSSKIVHTYRFPFNITQHLPRPLSSNSLSLNAPIGDSPLMLRDHNSCPIHLQPSFRNTLKDVDWMRFMPLTSYCQIVQPLRPGDPYSLSGCRILTFMTMRNCTMTPVIMRSEVEQIVNLTYPDVVRDVMDRNNLLVQLSKERVDGDRNIIHMAVAQSFPISNQRTSLSNESFHTKPSKETKSSLLSTNESNAWTRDTNSVEGNQIPDGMIRRWCAVSHSETERVSRGKLLLKCLLQTDCMMPIFELLLLHRNMDGLTPFMYAVKGRSYGSAIDILEKIKDMSTGKEDKGDFFRNAIFPVDDETNFDNSPLYMLCCNDTCSYTWTGDNHIVQDVYRCYTCNIQGSRCCCSECARVCHRNHECSLKPTSPTAYCDCWEDCKCKATIAGDKNLRLILFNMLLKETDIIKYRNGRGEPLLLFLAQTAARQLTEQRQYKGNSRTLLRIRRSAAAPSGNTNGNPSGAPAIERPTVPNPVTSGASGSIPTALFTCAQMLRRANRNVDDQLLAPPTFCHDVLQSALGDWNALKSVFDDNDDTIVDRFMLILLTQLPESIVNQLILVMDNEFEAFVKPLMESVARVTVHLTMITTNDARASMPVGILSNYHSRVPIELRSKRKVLSPLFDKACDIFNIDRMTAIQCLIDIAEALISPVKSNLISSEASLCLHNDVAFSIKAISESLSLSKTEEVDYTLSVGARRRAFADPTHVPNWDSIQASRIEDLLGRISDLSDNDEEAMEDANDGRRHTAAVRTTEGFGNGATTAGAAHDGRRRHRRFGRSAGGLAELANSDEIMLIGSEDDEDEDEDDNADDDGENNAEDEDVEEEIEDDDGLDDDAEEDDDDDDEDDEDIDDDGTDDHLDGMVFVHNGAAMRTTPRRQQQIARRRRLLLSNTSSGTASGRRRSQQHRLTLRRQSPDLLDEDEDYEEDYDDNDDDDDYEDDDDILATSTPIEADDESIAEVDCDEDSGDCDDVIGPSGGSANVQRRDTLAETDDNGDEDDHHGTIPPPAASSRRVCFRRRRRRNRRTDRAGGSESSSTLLIEEEQEGFDGGDGVNTIVEEHDMGVNIDESRSSVPHDTDMGGDTNDVHYDSVSLSTINHRDNQSNAQRSRPANVNGHRIGRTGDLSSINAVNDNPRSDRSIGNTVDNSAMSDLTPALRESLEEGVRECDDDDTDVDVEEVVAYSGESSEENTVERAINSSNRTRPNESRATTGLSRNAASEAQPSNRANRSSTNRNQQRNENEQPTSGVVPPAAETREMSHRPITLLRTSIRSGARANGEAAGTGPHRLATVTNADPIDAAGRRQSSERISARAAYCRGYANALRMISYIITSGQCDRSTFGPLLAQRFSHTWSWLCSLMDSAELAFRHAVWTTEKEDENGDHQTLIDNPMDSIFLNSMVDVARRDLRKMKRGIRISHTGSNHIAFRFHKGLRSLWSSKSLQDRSTLPLSTREIDDYLVYVLDAMLALQMSMDTSNDPLPFTIPWSRRITNNNADQQVPFTKHIGRCRRSSFFQRSESTLCLALSPPDPIATSVKDALPLVERPQVLQPATCKEELWFGEQRYAPSDFLRKCLLPNESSKATFKRIFTDSLHTAAMPIGDRGHLERWRVAIDCFTRIYVDSIGEELFSVLPCFSRFEYVETKFRSDAERLRHMASKEIRFENVERNRFSLIYKLFRCLNVAYLKATSSSNTNVNITFPLLTYSKVRVSFKDEPGEGVGVARSFFTSVIQELLSSDNLPSLESCQPLGSSNRPSANDQTNVWRERRFSMSPLLSSRGPYPQRQLAPCEWDMSRLNRIRRSMPSLVEEPSNTERATARSNDFAATDSEAQHSTVTRRSFRPRRTCELNTRGGPRLLRGLDIQSTLRGFVDDKISLFWKPEADKEFYAPRPAFPSSTRINAFRNIGRLMGLCLLNNDILPISLCRHVFKYILDREIRWHDLAFFDSTLYESMRFLLHQAESDPSADFNDIGVRWVIDLREDEGGETLEMVNNGSNLPVTAVDVHNYVKQYVQIRLVQIVEPFLQNMRYGILDVIPSSLFMHLNAEEFKLLLCGSDHINVYTLRCYSTFIDETGDTVPRKLKTFKRWFWSVVQEMSAQKRQDLVLFWTGSPTLPSSIAGFQAAPSITIRHPDDEPLPTANTCISRLYIPLYSSKRILKQKLYYAIKAKNFGFI